MISRFCMILLLVLSLSDCLKQANTLDPLQDQSALVFWLTAYSGLLDAAPLCGYATPQYRVSNPADVTPLIFAKHSRDNSTLNNTVYFMSGCTPVSVTNPTLPGTFQLTYYSNRFIRARTEVGTANVLALTLNNEGRVVRIADGCASGTIFRNFTYDNLNRMLTHISPPDSGCGWSGEETYYYYSGLSRQPTRITYYDSGSLFDDSLATYQFSGSLVTAESSTCLGGSSCSTSLRNYSYDALGRLTTESVILPSASTTTYTYDSNNRLLSGTSSGNTATFTYNGLGQLTNVHESAPVNDFNFTN